MMSLMLLRVAALVQRRILHPHVVIRTVTLGHTAHMVDVYRTVHVMQQVR